MKVPVKFPLASLLPRVRVLPPLPFFDMVPEPDRPLMLIATLLRLKSPLAIKLPLPEPEGIPALFSMSIVPELIIVSPVYARKPVAPTRNMELPSLVKP